MTSQDIRDKFLAFFKEKGHAELPPSSLIPNDPSVLFTTAGMQQFKEWFVKPEIAKHKRVVTIQPCLRTSDIEEVGDATHLTYFEMLGNFSFGDPARHARAGVAGGYGKKEAIEYALEWFRKDFGVEPSMLRFSYFGPASAKATAGKGDLPDDVESFELLKKMIPEDKIKARGKADNFWGPTGETGPCGPTVEFYYKGVEIWNLVFNEYFFDGKTYKKLEKLGIDTGAGLERIAATLNNFESVFETDELKAILEQIPEGDARLPAPERSDGGQLRSRRIIADHVRAINGLVNDGIVPSNKAQGAVLRRLIRRALTHARLIGADDNLLAQLVGSPDEPTSRRLSGSRPQRRDTVRQVVNGEIEKFSQTLKQAMNRYSNVLKKVRIANENQISAQDAFLLQQSYGLPVELTRELARKDGISFDEEGFRIYEIKHSEASTVSSQIKFKGGLVEITPETTRLHTAHHLLLAALRKVLGDRVVQRGSNITSERLRLDFSHTGSVKPEELQQVQDLVNQWIQDDLVVTHEEMALKDAYAKGALGEFGATYPERVSVYSIGSSHSAEASRDNRLVSVEICGGPHVRKTSLLGTFKITKEESSGAGIRRIKAIFD